MKEEKYAVYFDEDGSCVQVPENTTLLEAQILAGKMPQAYCGGKGTCGKCKVEANGKVVLACQTPVTADTHVRTAGPEKKTQILMTEREQNAVFQAEERFLSMPQPVLAAVDIGTTTVVVYLMDAKTGKLLCMQSCLNPQGKYGADVVSRCSYAMEHGADTLSSVIRNAVNDLLGQALKQSGRGRGDLMRIVFVGNTGMHHLFLELPVKQLVLAPYHPYQKEACVLSASECQIEANAEAEVWWLPNIGGFVGADTVGCILASNLPSCEEMTLMVDIGTNGEMVLGDKNGMIACSTAAGPAFEGAKITCGMRGSEGAIDKVWPDNGKIRYHVLGEGDAAGICGSGLLDAAAAFLETEIIDETGRLEETYYFQENVFLNQKDIRELQLAKAAIAAGIRILCMRKGIEVSDIRRVLLAGAFGNYLDPDSACAIGLLPEELRERIEQVGNAAGEGAQMAALDPSAFEAAKKHAAETEFLELALDPAFQDIYIDELEFGPQED